jgi:hypothetical protein
MVARLPLNESAKIKTAIMVKIEDLSFKFLNHLLSFFNLNFEYIIEARYISKILCS